MDYNLADLNRLYQPEARKKLYDFINQFTLKTDIDYDNYINFLYSVYYAIYKNKNASYTNEIIANIINNISSKLKECKLQKPSLYIYAQIQQLSKLKNMYITLQNFIKNEQSIGL